MSINNLNTYLNVRDAHLRVVSGNVYAQAMNIGGINVETAHGLQSVSNTGNATSLTLEFANVTTGFVTTANAQIGRDLVVTGNATVSTDLTVSANATVTDTLTVSEHLLASKEATVTGNLHVTTIMSDSNVVAEYTGPHDRPLRKYPEVALTQNDESATSGYVADTSSESGTDTALRRVYTLFDHIVPDGTTTDGWMTGGGYNVSDGTADGTETRFTGDSGHWAELRLPTSIKLTKFNLKPGGDNNTLSFAQRRFPKVIAIYGYNGTSWDRIQEYTTLPIQSFTDIQTFHVSNPTTYHDKFVLIVKQTYSVTGVESSATNIGEWELYGHEEGDASLDTTLKTVYNVPATTGTQLEVYYDAKDYTQTSDFAGSGGVVDKAGGDQDGTASSGVSFDSTYNAFVFDGTTNGKIVGTHNLSGTSPVLTMSFWMKRTAVVGTGWNYVATIGTSTTGQMIGLTINPSSQFNFSNYGDGTLTNEPILLDQWYHVTLVTNGEAAFNSTNFKMYINGKEAELSGHGGGSTTTLTGTQLTLGTNTNSGEAFNGSIANFRLYSKALNVEQIQELYDYQKDYFLGSKSQVTLYKGHLGVGVTEPSGQLELAGDERIQEYPPGPMDDYETLIPGHGVFCASASSKYTTADTFVAWKAFDKTDATFWVNDDTDTPETYDQTTGLYTGTRRLSEESVLGEYIILKLPYSINLKSFTIEVRSTELLRGPKSGIVYGRKNNKWEVVHSFSGVTYTASVRQNIQVNSNEYYNEFALVTTALAPNGSTYHNVNLVELKYFGTPGPTTLDKGSLSLTRSLDVPRISRYDVDTETPRPEKLLVDFDTTVNSSPTDISGKGNHGTFNNGAFYSAPDKAFVFDGTDDYIEATTNLGSGNQNVSFSMWINTHTAPRWFTWLGSEATGGGMGMYRSSSTYKIVVRNGGNLEISAGPLNTWEHLVFIYDSSTGAFKGYVNGESGNVTGSFIDTVDVFSLAANPPIEIGARTTAGSDPYFDGQISNFKLYNTVLEPSEVKKLYNLGRTGRSMVISDTAVGIGKAPEAQLDVRGNLNVDGVITNQQRPAFYVWRDNTSNYSAEKNTTGKITNWDSKRVDTAGTFDLSDGRYYIPVSGLYNFVGAGLYRYGGSGNGILELSFYVNGLNMNVRGLSYSRGNTSAEHHQVTITFMRFMNAGDYVQMGVHSLQSTCDVYYGDNLGYFSGYLLG